MSLRRSLCPLNNKIWSLSGGKFRDIHHFHHSFKPSSFEKSWTVSRLPHFHFYGDPLRLQARASWIEYFCNYRWLKATVMEKGNVWGWLMPLTLNDTVSFCHTKYFSHVTGLFLPVFIAFSTILWKLNLAEFVNPWGVVLL